MGKKNKNHAKSAFADMMGDPMAALGDLGAGLDLGGFDAMDVMAPDADPTPDPLADVPVTDDLAADAAAELGALEQGFKDRARQEAKRFRDTTDSEFWFAVVFKTRDEKDEFLARYKLSEFGDKYLTGRDLEKRIRPAKG